MAEARQRTNVLIDSHAVTKESYGYRVTPFSFDKLRLLNPTMICMLYAESAEIERRIKAESGGRPEVSNFQADFHIFLQAQVALAYSLELDLPLYVFDSTSSTDQASAKLVLRLNGNASD